KGRWRSDRLSVAKVGRANNEAGDLLFDRGALLSCSERQIALLENFAAQAVIAIGNTRLLNELRQRTDDLSESLEQQTATSEVLQVISSSPGELKPVFESMLASATRICGAKFGMLYLCEGDCFRDVAHHNVPSALAEHRRLHPVFRPGPSTGLGRVAATKQTAHISDITAEQAYIDGDPSFVMGVKLGVIAPSSRCQCSRRTAWLGHQHLSPASSNFHRQADRAGPEL